MNAAAPIATRALIDVGTAPVDAVARLEQSRLRLRHHLIALNRREAGPAGSPPPSGWLDSLRSIPLVGVALDTVSGWWSQHPLRVVVTLVAASAASVARPVTQRHPAWALFGALALGGLVIWARPWRFAPLRRAVYAGVLPPLLSSVLSRLPAQDWMSVAESLLRRDPTAPTSAGPAASPVIRPGFPPRSDSARTSPLH